MKNLIIHGTVTGTSNKQSEKFKGEHPTKTIYFIADDKNSQLLTTFGMKQYESDDGTKFFVVKASKTVKVYLPNEEKHDNTLPVDIESPNFKIDTPIKMNIICGEKNGNSFYRLQAVQFTDDTFVEIVEERNPFLN